jgi:hypothetical protein
LTTTNEEPIPDMPKYLGQIAAIQKDVQKATMRQLTDAHHALQKPAMLEGLSREYQPRFEDGEQLPAEQQRVQATVKEMIDATRDALARMFDATAARDYTNGPGGPATAVADVKVDGDVLVPKAPVHYLLYLEKQLDDLETFARKLPTHDPATDWALESPRGVWKAVPVQTTRVVQVPRANVIVPPTAQHPAQVQGYTENVVTGILPSSGHSVSSAISSSTSSTSTEIPRTVPSRMPSITCGENAFVSTTEPRKRTSLPSRKISSIRPTRAEPP